MTQEDAEINFLNKIKWVDSYGVDLYKVKVFLNLKLKIYFFYFLLNFFRVKIIQIMNLEQIQLAFAFTKIMPSWKVIFGRG